MPTPYHTLSDDTLNLLAERGNAQALMELAHRAERLGILAEAQELAKRLREGSTHQLCETPLVELLERVPEDARAWYEHSPMNHSHIPYGSLCRRAAAEIRSLTIKLVQCLREGSKDEKEDA